MAMVPARLSVRLSGSSLSEVSGEQYYDKYQPAAAPADNAWLSSGWTEPLRAVLASTRGILVFKRSKEEPVKEVAAGKAEPKALTVKAEQRGKKDRSAYKKLAP